ncbi:helicase domain protein [Candidatus Vecturithrix granuli]|uniref:Helicase domain protein n=1 Tax=Vecturithrix granuli TaxID=1499967 RepID=A0A081CA81_VECG1|nr:helicase domain protein [Candidatus Vecturithrix granuli]
MPGNIFIVDNADTEWKVQRYLHDWCDLARAFDIATAYFEIGAILLLDDKWQGLERIRILMGDEVSKRTKQAFEQGLREIVRKLDDSLEAEKEENDFLRGVPAIVEALRSSVIQARVYRRKKFHAKTYITHGKMEVIGSAALVGSSNFTCPGLTENIELNIRLKSDSEVAILQEWFETYWNEAEDVTPDLLKTIERHTREYSPFEVYARALSAYFEAHEPSVSEWEKQHSQIYPILDYYQQEGYHRVIEIGRRYNGALLCDGVGLGKTFIGLMLIERFLFERKRVALFVPKAARKDVWENNLKKYLPEVRGKFSNLAIYNHTDLLRGGDFPEWMQEIAEKVDVILIDEAHHFRNASSDRTRKMFEIIDKKQVFLLTATPINNSLYDLMHLIELFSRRQPDYFRAAPLGIHSLRGHFRALETALRTLVGEEQVEMDAISAEEMLSKDDLFRELVVQRSRAYVKRSIQQHGGQRVAFPIRRDPVVANYSLQKTYGKLLDMIEVSFNKEIPLLSLPMYYPLAYYRGQNAEIDPMLENRQRQVVGLIRTLLLKRFESSAKAFEASCEDLLLKLLQFVRLNQERLALRWEKQHAALLEKIQQHLHERGLAYQNEEERDEDIIPEDFKKRIEHLDEQEYDVHAILNETLLDMEELVRFLQELQDFDPSRDDKLQTLIALFRQDENLQGQKVLVFTEYVDTARYLRQQLQAAGIGPLAEVDSLTSSNTRSAIIRNFSPYYNDSSSPELQAQGIEEIRVLISTDVLSEGLNLQDAACLMNYDVHWNPVRLMQRIGRVDRRLNPDLEARILRDHPEQEGVRGTVCLWNFLPPAELDRILGLYERVAHKTLRISKIFGIEGRKLLTPEDEYDALKEFNKAYEGQTTSLEEMQLAYQQLLRDHPDLENQIRRMPLRVFSGKAHVAPDVQAVFFCYSLPAKDAATGEWDDNASFTRWYLYDLATETISDDASAIFPIIRSKPETPRLNAIAQTTLREIRKQIEKKINKDYLRKVQAPVGIKATLLAWMELV